MADLPVAAATRYANSSEASAMVLTALKKTLNAESLSGRMDGKGHS